MVVDLGWVDLDFECSTGLKGIWQKGLGKLARWWNTVNPTHVLDQMGHSACKPPIYRVVLLAKQNRAEGGTTKIIVNLAQQTIRPDGSPCIDCPLSV